MKIIDARSGQEMQIGKVIDYGGGERVTLLQFKPGLFKAQFFVDGTYRVPGQGLQRSQQWVTGPVRYLHPGFPLQQVAFFPS